jgi:hypothetical protein
VDGFDLPLKVAVVGGFGFKGVDRSSDRQVGLAVRVLNGLFQVTGKIAHLCALTSVFREPSNFANWQTRDRQGRLVTCEHGTRRVTRTEYDGSITVLAD